MFAVVNSYLLSSPAATDPNFANVVFLAGFEGGSVTDESPLAQTVTTSGAGATQSSAQAKFGSKSFNRTGGSSAGTMKVPDHASFFDALDHFTIEAWIRITAEVDGFNPIIAKEHISSGTGWEWEFGYRGDAIAGNRQLYLNIYEQPDNSGDSTSIVGTWDPNVDTWYHVAADFDGTTYRLYVDGVMVGSDTYTVSIVGGNAAMSLGAYLDAPTGGGFDGYIDEARVTAGVARYASDGGYTVPTAAFPRS